MVVNVRCVGVDFEGCVCGGVCGCGGEVDVVRRDVRVVRGARCYYVVVSVGGVVVDVVWGIIGIICV